ncbi:kinectin-like [Dendronephthya gigantea]|uniref:kinectin-like n=1 Tax=Dendronephthya gigantea TaxID=151771 RepID=UPI00106B06DC|nr:kinectin-like [Dendronephthya gigantea]
MMATRKPKVAPSKSKHSQKEQKSSSSEDIELRDQAWTDVESGSGSEQLKGSLISVKEAEDGIDNTEFGGTPEPQTTSEVNSTHETFFSESTRNGFSHDGDAESETTSESQKKTKIKRNTVSPVDEEVIESGRDTPESLPSKGAWEDTPLSRPSSAPAQEGERDSGKKGKKRRVTVGPIEEITQRPWSRSAIINKGYIGDNKPGSDVDIKTDSTSGSRVSLLKNPFSKTATVEPFSPEPENDGDIEPGVHSAANGDNPDERAASSASSGVLALPASAGEQNAYIPLTYAKDCLQKVMDDMKRMKGLHLKIVGQIQEQYKLIEEDSRGQFNQYVISIRDQYQSKVATFRQVIEIHQADLENKESFWKNSYESLKEKNRTLLQEKRQLLLKNKDEFSRLEAEKIVIIKNLTNLLDEKHAKYIQVKRQLGQLQNSNREMETELVQLRETCGNSDVQHAEEMAKTKADMEDLSSLKEKQGAELVEVKSRLETIEKENQELKTVVEKEKEEVERKTSEENELKEKSGKEYEALQVEIKRLKEENENLKVEVQNTQTQAATVVVGTVAASKVGKDIEKSTEQAKVIEPVPVISSEEEARLKTEISSQKEKINSLEEDLAKRNEKFTALDDNVRSLTADKERYENQLTSLRQDLTQSRQRSEALHLQLEGLLSAVSPNQDEKQTEVQLKKAVEEKTDLMVEVEKLKGEVEEWKEKYKQENDQKEISEDVSEEYEQLVMRLAEEEAKVHENETKIAVMTMLKEGSVPENLPTPAGGLSKDLEELEEKLSKNQEERDSLNLELERARNDQDELQGKLGDAEERIQELENELEEIRQELIDAKNASSGESIEEVTSHLDELKQQLAQAQQEKEIEKTRSNGLLEEIEKLTIEMSNARDGSSTEVDELKAKLASTQETLQGESKVHEEQLGKAKERIAELEKQLRDNLPVDVGKELETCQAKVNAVEVEKVEMTKNMLLLQGSNKELTSKVDSLNKTIEANKKTKKELQENHKKSRVEMDEKLKNLSNQAEIKHKKQADEHNKKIKSLQQKIKELETTSTQKVAAVPVQKKDSRVEEKLQREKEKLHAQVEALKKAAQEDSQKMKSLEKDLKEAKAKPSGGGGAEDRIALKKTEKQLKGESSNLDMEKKKNERNKENMTKLEEEHKELKKTYDSLNAESKGDKAELLKLGVAAKEGLEAQEKVQGLTTEVKKLQEENKTLTENYNSERILRKKYYNMVEDMKGKIRVYCRSRPLSGSELERGNHSVIKSPDEYSISVETARGPKEFQFDQIFTEESTQEKVFEDTFNLVQSAVDGYNVCIFAYGQTGSGKTFTMIGDKDQKFPGIAPRAMERIFAVINENKGKFAFKVSVYMLELYNDRLIDLLAENSNTDAKLDIKKDKKGLVFVHGANVLDAADAQSLYGIFEKGSENRHVASTKMNSESSRSHLVLSIIIESTNKTTGSVLKGKLSLVDLAGSERASKTQASAEQLKEAQSINKSLSALGDVISALSSEQQFIPYRNNKLTMLMQDSLGGNAKTLMFVNISPADYNTDETVTSLTYASRVKLITNDASKNAENKEIVRLKGIIAKLKQGESVDDEEQ